MLPNAVIYEVQRLVDEGELSYRAIAAKLHISHGSVQNVAEGRRTLRRNDLFILHYEEDQPPGLATRCGGCGGLIYQPCRLCQARAYNERRRQMRRLVQGAGSPRRPPRRVA